MSSDRQRFIRELVLGRGQDRGSIDTTPMGIGSENLTEDDLIDAIDQARVIEKYAKEIKDLRENKIDMTEFMEKMSVPAMVTLIYAMNSTTSLKDKASIAQDILDRAGHGKINKMAIASRSFDKKSSEDELISHILGMARGTNIIDIKE